MLTLSWLTIQVFVKALLFWGFLITIEAFCILSHSIHSWEGILFILQIYSASYSWVKVWNLFLLHILLLSMIWILLNTSSFWFYKLNMYDRGLISFSGLRGVLSKITQIIYLPSSYWLIVTIFNFYNRFPNISIR